MSDESQKELTKEELDILDSNIGIASEEIIKRIIEN